MTDNEIIKALECCRANNRCDTCPRLGMNCCMNLLMRNALALINRQKAEIERLENEIAEANSIERKNELQALEENKENAKLFLQTIQHARSEAIKEFVHRLKDRVVQKYEYTDIRIFEEIDNLVKEMTEVEK